MVKLKLAKFQGPVIPERRHEPAQIVQEVPPLNVNWLFASGMADAIKPEYADMRFTGVLSDYHRQEAYAEQQMATMQAALVEQLVAKGYDVTQIDDEIIATERDADRVEGSL